MDTTTILIIINLIISTVTPIITSFSYFIQHIHKSECCGSSVELNQSNVKDTVDIIKKDSDSTLKEIKKLSDTIEQITNKTDFSINK